MLGEGLRAGLGHLGIETRAICYVEREAHAASVLAARIEEGSLDPAPVWSDMLTFDARAWHGAVDCVAAGFPCQDLSLAGRRAGLDGQRSGLFFRVVDIANDCGAWLLFLENVAGIASATASVVDEAEGDLDERAAARVVGELADRGWHAEWITLSASDVGASHGRARWFCIAWRVAHAGGHGGHGPYGEGRSGRRVRAAGHTVDDAECAERWSIGARVAGALEGHDTRRREAHGGLGVAVEVLGDTERARWPQTGCGSRFNAGREPEPGCCAVADYGCFDARRRQHIAGSCRIQAEHHACCDDLADASSARCQGYELGRACACNGGGQEAHGPTSQFRGLFAPGPADPRWGAILADHPELAPALEPTFRSVVDGLAFSMGDSRAARLKCVGNGVVALQAAAGIVELVRRARN